MSHDFWTELGRRRVRTAKVRKRQISHVRCGKSVDLAYLNDMLSTPTAKPISI